MSSGQAKYGAAAREDGFETRDFYLACFLRCTGYELLDLTCSLPSSLRFHRGLKHPSGGAWPCMVALVTKGADDKPLAIHRTFLAREGKAKGQQKVTVEHVHVHAGGQAVVGTVERPGGGDQTKVEEQPHAKQIAHAPEPTLWGSDAERDAVPVPCDDERPLPDARGKVSRRADRE